MGASCPGSQGREARSARWRGSSHRVLHDIVSAPREYLLSEQMHEWSDG